MNKLRFGLLLLVMSTLLVACGAAKDHVRGIAEPAGDSIADDPPTILVGGDSELGPMLTDNFGRTLYMYLQDVPGSGRSAVPDDLMSRWPVFSLVADTLVSASKGRAPNADGYGYSETNPNVVSGVLGVIIPAFVMDANEATKPSQVTYNGRPLYYFAGDLAPGQINGDNLDNFVVARP